MSTLRKDYNYPQQPQQRGSYFNQLSSAGMIGQQQLYILKGRPVSSLEEAKASTIDFDGSIFFFPDLANKRIYTKQINLDGTAQFNVYEYIDIPAEELTSPQYITRSEFNKALEDLRLTLKNPEQLAPPQEFNIK